MGGLGVTTLQMVGEIQSIFKVKRRRRGPLVCPFQKRREFRSFLSCHTTVQLKIENGHPTGQRPTSEARNQHKPRYTSGAAAVVYLLYLDLP